MKNSKIKDKNNELTPSKKYVTFCSEINIDKNKTLLSCSQTIINERPVFFCPDFHLLLYMFIDVTLLYRLS